MILTKITWILLYVSTKNTQKREENHFHFFIFLLEHVTVNATGASGIPPEKGNRGQYFVYFIYTFLPLYIPTFLFISNQFIILTTKLWLIIMLTHPPAPPAPPAPPDFCKSWPFTNPIEIIVKRKSSNIYIYIYIYIYVIFLFTSAKVNCY